MSRLLRQYGVVPLRGLVLLKLPVAFHNPGVVHADQGVLATTGIEYDLGVPRILTLHDIGPKQVFIMLWRLLPPEDKLQSHVLERSME